MQARRERGGKGVREGREGVKRGAGRGRRAWEKREGRE